MPNGVHVRLAIMAKCEPGILARCVETARHLVDSACIVIAPKDYTTLPGAGLGLPTHVHQVPWSGFASMRTKTYALAGEDPAVDYVLIVDADEVFTPSSELPDLREGVDLYWTPIEHHGIQWRWRWFRNWQLLRARRGFEWVGQGPTQVHETLITPEWAKVARHPRLVISNVPMQYSMDEAERKRQVAEAQAARAGGRTYADDVESLAQHMETKPDTRCAFYYAQSLKDAGRFEEAFDAFAHRARMAGGNEEETFWSKLWMGKLARHVNEDPIRFYLEAHRHSPLRAEPLHAISTVYRWDGRHVDAYDFARRAADCPYPKDANLFVEVHTYSEQALAEAGIDP